MGKRGLPAVLLVGLFACSVGSDTSGGGFGNPQSPPPDDGGAGDDGTSYTGTSSEDGASGSEAGGTETSDPTTGVSTGGPTGESGTTTGGATTMEPSECGNDVREGDEPCDGTDFGTDDCAAFGFGAGDLTCSTQCTVQTDGCYTCGDAMLQGPEVCDGTNFGFDSCVDQGFGPGDLTCDATCLMIDTSSCPPLPVCGNDMVEGTEQCDGTNLDGESCVTQGYDTGSLGCTVNCTFDYQFCMIDTPTCGAPGTPCGTPFCCSGICINNTCA